MAPTFVARYESAWNTATSPKTLSVTVAAGDVLVIYGITQDAGTTLATPTGGGLTYTQRQVVSAASYCWVSIWTASAASAQTFTLSVTAAGNGLDYGVSCLRFSGVAAVGASAQAHAAGAGSVGLTTTGAGSAIVAAIGDWNALSNAGTWLAIDGVAATQQTGLNVSGAYTVWGAYWSGLGAAGAKTAGLSAPSGQKYSIAAVELTASAGPAYSGTGSAALTLGSASAGTPRPAGTAAAALGLSAPTAAGTPRVTGTGSIPLPLAAAVTGSPTLAGAGTAALTLATAAATLPPYVVAPPSPALAGRTGSARIGPPFRLLLAETVSGQVVADLPIAAPPSWSRQINGSGSLSATVALAPRLDDDTLQMLREPWRWTLAYAYGSIILQAGMVAQVSVDDSQQPPTAAITTTTLWDYLDKKALAIYEQRSGGASVATGDIVFGPASTDPGNTALSWASVAARLVWIWSYYTAGAYAPPILLPDPVTGAAEITYAAADLASLGQRLADLTKLAERVEIEFSPEWADDAHAYLRWRMRAVDGRLGQLGYPHAWDYGQACTALTATVDGTGMTFDVFAKGQDSRSTSGGALAWSSAYDETYPAAGWPWLQTADTSHSSETSVDVLHGYALGELDTNTTPRFGGAATVRMDGRSITGAATGSPPVEAVQVGDTAVIHVAGHPYLTPGQYAVRLLTVANGADQWSAVGTVQMIGPVTA